MLRVDWYDKKIEENNKKINEALAKKRPWWNPISLFELQPYFVDISALQKARDHAEILDRLDTIEAKLDKKC